MKSSSLTRLPGKRTTSITRSSVTKTIAPALRVIRPAFTVRAISFLGNIVVLFINPIASGLRRSKIVHVPIFFPIGQGKHMLLMHSHMPYFQAQYYIGTWDSKAEKFVPESTEK